MAHSDSNTATRYVALTGNPNCGKTTVFNALTGMRAKVGNYAGVTVERKEGKLKGGPADAPITILDLPGTYSLSPKSLDEQISRDVLFHRLKDVPAPSLVVVVVDASNLERNLYYATQVIELGYPTVVALNMLDVAEQNQHSIDPGKLSDELGVPVLSLIASSNQGIDDLRGRIVDHFNHPSCISVTELFVKLPQKAEGELQPIVDLLAQEFRQRKTSAHAEALLLLTDEKVTTAKDAHYPNIILDAVRAARERLEKQDVQWRSVAIEARYGRIAGICEKSVTQADFSGETFSDRVDQVVTHKVWGTLIFAGIMILIFQSIFSFASVPMDLLEGGFGALGEWVNGMMPEGELRSLIVDGVIAGVGGVLVFLPQILFLFLFIGLLEDTGYMARAAFLMDRLMSKVGLHGKSFIPMLSSYACAIPGIMATRTIESPKDRLVTILIAPLMSCSARLPVYTLLIAACIPKTKVFGFIGLPALTLFSMYLLGTVVAFIMAWIFKKTLLKGEAPMLILEMPPYKRPLIKQVVRHMWDRSKLFLRRAGTVILGISIILWFLQTYPKNDTISQTFADQRAQVEADGEITLDGELDSVTQEKLDSLDKQESGELLAHSFAGRIGHLIEPVFAPLGFDWKIGIGIVASFAAREVFVSTMSTIYSLGGSDDDEGIKSLAERLTEQDRADGSRLYTPLLGVTLMVFYVFALQCVSTIAVVRRETNGWKWPLFQFAYMFVLAWGFAFVAWHGGKLLGFV
jgi:ferrous iron transport protein B